MKSTGSIHCLNCQEQACEACDVYKQLPDKAVQVIKRTTIPNSNLPKGN